MTHFAQRFAGRSFVWTLALAFLPAWAEGAAKSERPYAKAQRLAALVASGPVSGPKVSDVVVANGDRVVEFEDRSTVRVMDKGRSMVVATLPEGAGRVAVTMRQFSVTPGEKPRWESTRTFFNNGAIRLTDKLGTRWLKGTPRRTKRTVTHEGTAYGSKHTESRLGPDGSRWNNTTQVFRSGTIVRTTAEGQEVLKPNQPTISNTRDKRGRFQQPGLRGVFSRLRNAATNALHGARGKLANLRDRVRTR